MRRFLPLAILFILVAAAPARAQYAGGYLFTGASGPNGPLAQFGGGLELVFGKGIGASVECGVASKGDRDTKLSHFTLNGAYHLKTKSGRVDPFIVGGWGFIADWDAIGGAVAIGGGLNYWLQPRVGVRVEVKDNIGLFNHGYHMAGVRVGITLR